MNTTTEIKDEKQNKSDPNAQKPGYKKTKLGWIPEEWNYGVLGDFIIIKSGESPSKYKLINDGEHPFIKVDDLNNCKKIQFSSRFYSNDKLGLIPKKFLIFPKRGAAILNNKIRILGTDALIDTNLMAISSTCKNLDNEFLYYYINEEKLYKIADTSTIPQLNNKHLLPYKIKIPPLPEQQKIAQILSTWDRAIEKTEQLIEKKQHLKKGLMQQLLSGKVRFPEFEDSWEKYRIKDLVKEVDRKIEWDDNAKYNLLSIRRRSEGLFFRESKYGKEIKTKGFKKAKKGDFLISKMQIVHGAAALVTENYDGMMISNSYIALVTKDNYQLSMEYFNYLSQTPYFYYLTFLASYGVHIEKMTFNLKLFLKSIIKIPSSIDEQKRIVLMLDSINKEISLLKKQLENYRTEKKGLMQQLLTGRIRVKSEDRNSNIETGLKT